jgi:PAS domain S-box-containing protein
VERERYLSHLIDSAPFGVVSTDESGAILTYNGKAETMLGHSEDEMRGGDIQRLLATPLDTRGLQPGATPARCELLHRDGTRVPVLIHSSEIRDSGRSLRARLHVLEDRTEREQVESQLLQAERLSVLGQMAPRLAHEFKTPLQVVMGNADLATLALDGDDLDDCRHCMEEIGPAVEQMNGLVRQMLDLGKPQKSRVEAIDLADEIAKLLGVLRPLRVLQACSVSTDFDNRLPSVLGDPAQIEQVLRNLIVNAAQAMEDGDDPRLELSLRADNAQRVVVTIRDSGCGIPAPDLEQIFQPFYTTKPEGKGTGLGLPIVKTILDRHGATIDVTSTPGAGTVFTIAFPAVHSDPPDEDTTLLEVAS